jgi:predicted amidohydrolase YtcJ
LTPKILYSAHIYTLNPNQPTASALAIDHGRVLALGNDQQILSEFEHSGEAIDLGGRAIIPGLTDAHIHLEHYALSLQKVNCETPSKQECLQRVAERTLRTPKGAWILGHGWNQNDWPEGFGNAADLDAVAPDHPVYLTAHSLHAGWANSIALSKAGISAGSGDPPGGRIQRQAGGDPTGILFENAMALVGEIVPAPDPETLSQAIKSAQQQLFRMGVTGVHDFDRQLCFQALQILHARGELNLRVTKSIPWEALPYAVEIGLRTGFGDNYLRIGSVKAFSDGALGPHTAAMIQPYEGEPENRGMLMLDAEEIFEKGRGAVENGLSLAIHAIGDRANHEVLNAFSQLRAFEAAQLPKPGAGALPPLRHRIEHVQIIHPDDVSRLAQLGVIASMQPIHVTSDYPAAERFWGTRAAHSYAWRTLLDQGTLMAYGSDAPVESPNPFWGLHAAVTRSRRDGAPGPQGWYPEQKLTLDEALRGYTTGAAYAAGMENRLGRLAPNYYADLLVLETDPFTCEADQLSAILPLATMVEGKWVYSRIE